MEINEISTEEWENAGLVLEGVAIDQKIEIDDGFLK